ncbi:MAG: endonuclease III, partial [Planctomycetia bacterium]|nr:endonuclease III [Planctomycetia bacterium]
MPPTPELKAHARRVLRSLKKQYPDARCALHYENPLQLLIATILSAQCTDVRVNKVTPALFAQFPDVASFAHAKPKELERAIQSTGFFRNKARNIIQCCQQIIERHQGEVPRTLDELVQLAGIGRKTANVILGNAFDMPGITVDTHLGRLSRRMGLSTQTNPVKVERDLMELVPRKHWTMFSHWMIHHGRQVCHARRPACDRCVLAKYCPRVGVVDRKPESNAAS